MKSVNNGKVPDSKSAKIHEETASRKTDSMPDTDEAQRNVKRREKQQCKQDKEDHVDQPRTLSESNKS